MKVTGYTSVGETRAKENVLLWPRSRGDSDYGQPADWLMFLCCVIYLFIYLFVTTLGLLIMLQPTIYI